MVIKPRFIIDYKKICIKIRHLLNGTDKRYVNVLITNYDYKNIKNALSI